MTLTRTEEIAFHNAKVIAKRNTLNLWGLRGFLKHNPQKHDQSAWMFATPPEGSPEHFDPLFECGTTACAAGWMCLLAGDVPDFDGFRGRYSVRIGCVIDPTGERDDVKSRAQKLMGISNPMADALYAGNNQLPHLLKALKMLAQGKTDREVITYLGMFNSRTDIEYLSDWSERP